jgi:hypothetical protein
MIDRKPLRHEWVPEGHVPHDWVPDPDNHRGCLHEYSDGICGRAAYWAGHTPICKWVGDDGGRCGHYWNHEGKHSSEDA